jgi:hypothetical protein
VPAKAAQKQGWSWRQRRPSASPGQLVGATSPKEIRELPKLK